MSQDLSKRIRGVEAKYSADRIIAKDLDIALDILKFQVSFRRNCQIHEELII